MSDINVTSCKTPKILVDVCTGPQGPSGPPGPPAAVLEWNYYPVAGQTTLAGIDASGQEPMVFNPESVQVFGNGVMLEKTKDYVVVGDHTIELQQPALGGGDVYTILSQVPPVDYDPTHDTINLQLQINANADAITDLDGRVTKNESDIADLQAQHTGNLTTQDIGTVGPNPFGTRSLDTQYDVNWAISDRLDCHSAAIDDNTIEIATLGNTVANLSSDLQDVSDDLTTLGGRVTINEISIAGNANDIVSLQDQINNLPAPPDVTPIVDDLAALEIRVGAAEGDIIDLRRDVDALGAPVDLTPLENRVGVLETQVSANTNSIGSLTATVNGHTTTLNSHGTRLTKLEASVIALELEHADLAYTNVDNSFTVAQTVQSGITLRGSDAHIYADTGTPIAFWNNNQFNPVISILRSNKIDVALTLNADGSILGVKDVNDDASAVSKKYVDDAVGSVDLTDYAKQDDLDQEIQDRKDGDAGLQSQIDSLSASGGYNDAWIQPAIDAGDAATLSDANAYTDAAVANVTVDLTGYAKTDYVDAGDEALQLQIDALSASGGYNDAWIQPAIDAGDNSTLTAANAYADSLFGNVTHPDLTGFETILKSEADDAATLNSAIAYADTLFSNITHPAPPNLAPYATIAYSDAGDNTTLNAANAYADTLFGNVTHPAPPNLAPYATIAYSDAGDSTTLNSSKAYTDAAIGNITHPAPPDTKGFLKKDGDTTTGRLTHAGADIVVFTGEIEYGGPGQPSGGGVTGKCTVMNLEPEGDRSPVNELKFIVPNSGAVRDLLNRHIAEGIRTDLILASASGEQRWTGKGAGWFSPTSTFHLSAEAVEGDILSDGESVGVKAVEKAKYLLEGEIADVDDSNFVKKTGGDSMEGPLSIIVQSGNTNAREDRRLHTLGVYSNSNVSALRLGTTRDRVYVGHDDTSINGLLKINEIGEKDADRGTSFLTLIKADDDILHTPTNVSFTDLISKTEQNKQDIVSLSQLFADTNNAKMAGRYRQMSTPAPREGELTIQDGSYTNSGTTVIHMNKKDLNGFVNTGADIDPGDVVEILNVSDEGFGVFEVTGSNESGDLININVKHVRGYLAPIMGLECRMRLINIADLDVGIADLDDRYLQVAGDTAEGSMVFNGTVETKKMVKMQRPTASGTAGEGFTLYGRVPSNSSTAQKVLQLYHNSDSSGDAVNYYGKESANTNLMSRAGINSLIVGKGYATETYVTDAINDLSIPEATPDATNSTKGKAKLGQVQRASGPPGGGLAQACLYWDYTNRILYIGG